MGGSLFIMGGGDNIIQRQSTVIQIYEGVAHCLSWEEGAISYRDSVQSYKSTKGQLIIYDRRIPRIYANT